MKPRAILLATLATAALVTVASAAPRFIGPWFTEASLNTLTNQITRTAGQNTTKLGITFTCLDNTLSLGVWSPRGSFGMEVPRKAKLRIRIDAFDPIELAGAATKPNLAEFLGNTGLVVREMLAGQQAQIAFTSPDGEETREVFRLDNAAIAFADIGGAYPL